MTRDMACGGYMVEDEHYVYCVCVCVHVCLAAVKVMEQSLAYTEYIQNTHDGCTYYIY